jgi:excisionase family DNA binding protein
MRPFRVPEQLLLPWSPQQTISVEHAAEMLDVSVWSLYRMIEDGTIKAYKIRPDKPQSPRRVNYDSVLALLDRIYTENGLEKRF